MEKITISIDVVTSLVCFALGIAFAFLLSAVNKTETLREKFGNPIDGSFELNWTVRKILRSIGCDRAEQRWYEARAYLDCGVFISILCAMGLMYVVRFEFESASDSHCVFSKKKRYHGLRSYDSLEKAILRDAPKVRETIGEDSFFSGALITGHNFVSL